MNNNDCNKQIVAAIRQSSAHNIDQPGYNNSNVIPFPMARVSRKAIENSQPGHGINPMIKILFRFKKAVLRIANRSDRVLACRKRKSALPFNDSDQPEAWGNGDGSRQNTDIRMNLLNS
jgi:hypothetical protein